VGCFTRGETKEREKKVIKEKRKKNPYKVREPSNQKRKIG